MRRKTTLSQRVGVYCLSILMLLGSFSGLANAQVVTTSRISITVVDPQGAVVSDVQVVVKNVATGTEYKASGGSDGQTVLSSLPVGTYTVTVSAKGFKQTVVQNVTTTSGTTASVTVTLEVGATNEVVTVTGGATILEKESTTIGSTIVGKQITQLPFTSRDALDLVLNLPGTSGGGRPRQSTVNGLPKSALNITLDGINVQDTNFRSSDGFFTYIRARIDAIEEVRVTTAGQTAESAAGGAVQIGFVTKSGTNEYHGGGWWYNRQRAFNANYYFNKLNRRTLADGTKVETPRAQVMVNQWGFKVGGPITPWLKDKAFFFFSYDSFHLPEQAVRTRTILSPDAQNGIFKIPDITQPSGFRTFNLYSLAGANGFPTTPDPTIAKVLGDIRSSTAKGAVVNGTDPNFQSFTFTNTGGQVRRFPDARFDFNITSKHRWEVTYHYNDFAGQADFLNGVDPAFPDPLPQIFGIQGSDRFSFSTALRSQLTSSLVNEARYGLTGGTVGFFANLAPGDFSYFGSTSGFPGIAPVFPVGSNPFSLTTNSRRNGPRFEFRDTVSYLKGRHNFSFGGSWIKDALFQQSSGGAIVPTVNFGVATNDPAFNSFNSIPSNFQGTARALYGLLTGRVTAVNINGKLNEETKKYSLNEQAIERNQSYEYGFFGQDAFRLRDNLTINYGLRWEAVLAPVHKNGVYIRPGYANLFGVSGVGNIFKPGTLSGQVPFYNPVTENDKPYDDDLNNFAPNIGIAWTPRFKSGWLKTLFGEGDQTVFRAGYSVSFFKGGNFDFQGVWASNPGLTNFAGKRADIEFPAGSVLLRNGLPTLTPPADPSFPRPFSVGLAMWDFDPEIKTPYVQSWSAGVQREIMRDTVLEVRYVGNRSIYLPGNVQVNEVNVFESGFLQEFLNAQKNLAIARANGRGNNFRNQGLAGQVALPIFEASFGSATSSQFASGTFVTALDFGTVGSAANTLAFNTTFHNNRVARGLAPNLFITNPSILATSAIQTNIGSSYYNSLQVELRRRLANGLLIQGSYTFARALETFGYSIRNLSSGKRTSSFDLRHAFKANYLWEFPIGPGQKFLNFRGPGGVIGKILEGWESDGIIRWQSGRQFRLNCGRATFNAGEAGCNLVGITNQELQKMVKVYKDGEAANRGTVFFLPRNFIENTQKAFGTIAGTPQGAYLAPPKTPGKVGSFIDLYGPNFFRADLSIAKKTRITETTNIEFRTEFLNAFNNINFLVGSAAADSTGLGVGGLTFGQTNSAYLDTSTTNDPGGRLIQFVLRLNF
ncbi:MAG: TonB-dependent receptor [Acidobacteriota bacterium]